MGRGIKVSKSNIITLDYNIWKTELPGGTIEKYDDMIIFGSEIYPLAKAEHNVVYVSEVGSDVRVYLQSETDAYNRKIVWNKTYDSGKKEFSDPTDRITSADSVDNITLHAKWSQYIFKAGVTNTFNKTGNNILLESGDDIFSWK